MISFSFNKNEDGTLYSEQLGEGVVQCRNSSGLKRVFIIFTDKNNLVWVFSK